MGETKLKLAFFTVPEYEKEQEWLIRQHKSGWKLRNAKLPCFYTFEKCEPEDVVYQLDYNQEGMAQKSEYVQMFRDCGWEHITDMAGYSYFRKPVSEMQEREEIFCDDASRMDMIERVYKGRMLPLIAIFFCTIIPNLFLQSRFENLANQVLFWVFVCMFVVYLLVFVQFGIQYTKLKKKMDR